MIYGLHLKHVATVGSAPESFPATQNGVQVGVKKSGLKIGIICNGLKVKEKKQGLILRSCK